MARRNVKWQDKKRSIAGQSALQDSAIKRTPRTKISMDENF